MWGSSLLRDYLDDFVFMDSTTEPDGYGGYRKTWKPGAPFKGVLVKSNSTQDLASGAASSTTFYTIKVDRTVPLDYRAVFKRVSDDQVFRVTADQGMSTPDMSHMNMTQFPVEEWKIPNG